MEDTRSTSTSPRARAWRLSTAVRVFGLAFVVGLAAQHGSLGSTALVLPLLGLVALVASLVELRTFGPQARWVPVVEGVVVSALLGVAQYDVSLAPYLIVPAVVAGARHGWVPAMNTGLLATLGLVTGIAVTMPTAPTTALGVNLPWAVLGLAGGLLAGWQSRSLRRLEERQAPYAAAHQLVAQLHRLVDSDALTLDPAHVAGDLLRRLRVESGATEAAVVISEHGRAVTLVGPSPRSVSAATLELPLRLEGRTFGAVVLDGIQEPERLESLQAMVDEAALHLETALTFGEVRERATTEERARLAREIHDGVAQEMVALGYLIDELEDHTASTDGRATSASLRHEVDRILTDLRSSIFDLRHELADEDLAGALSRVASEAQANTGLSVHLSVDEHVAPPRHVQAELLRVAQEAVGNARRHAHARNLWVTLGALHGGCRLRIADDGIGGAGPVTGHYGVHTMRERAERIGARFSVDSRPGAGTVVQMEWLSDVDSPGRRTYELQSPAGR